MNTAADGVALAQRKHATHGVGTGDRLTQPVAPEATGPGMFQGVEVPQPGQLRPPVPIVEEMQASCECGFAQDPAQPRMVLWLRDLRPRKTPTCGIADLPASPAAGIFCRGGIVGRLRAGGLWS